MQVSKVEVDVTKLQSQVLRKVNLCYVNFGGDGGGKILGQQNNPISIVAVCLKGLRRQGIYKMCVGFNKGQRNGEQRNAPNKENGRG